MSELANKFLQSRHLTSVYLRSREHKQHIEPQTSFISLGLMFCSVLRTHCAYRLVRLEKILTNLKIPDSVPTN